MSDPVSFEFYRQWDFDYDWNYPFKNFQFPTFSPLSSVKFCFEYYYSVDLGQSRKRLKLRLVKLKEERILTSLKMDVHVTLHSSEDRLIKTYKPVHSINVHQMKELNFEDIFLDGKIYNIKCLLIFFIFIPAESTTTLREPFFSSNENHKLFVNNFKSAYETCLFSDVKFIIGEKSLPAHKVILAAQSPVFAKMLTDDFKESSTNIITITDTSYEVFNIFLKSLYSGEISDRSWSNVRELYVIADKYDVAILKRECQQIILSLLSMDTVCDVLVVAFTYDDNDLKMAAKDYANANIKNLVASEEWKNLVESHPRIGYEVLLKLVPLK